MLTGSVARLRQRPGHLFQRLALPQTARTSTARHSIAAPIQIADEQAAAFVALVTEA
ncbi:hypothetical protein C4K39_4954 [Pseudomonas sessilinigenes]|nr:hypothetical protein C4K39_4954 [Pseudomonas sessilinigenes]